MLLSNTISPHDIIEITHSHSHRSTEIYREKESQKYTLTLLFKIWIGLDICERCAFYNAKLFSWSQHRWSFSNGIFSTESLNLIKLEHNIFHGLWLLRWMFRICLAIIQWLNEMMHSRRHFRLTISHKRNHWKWTHYTAYDRLKRRKWQLVNQNISVHTK